LNETGIITIGVPGAPVRVGNFLNPTVQLAILGFILIGILMMKKIKGAILLGILSVTAISVFFGISPIPEKVIGLPPDISPIFLKVDLIGAFTWGFFAVILTVFVMDFVDTIGTLIGLAYSANMLDERATYPKSKNRCYVTPGNSVWCFTGNNDYGNLHRICDRIEAGARSGFPLLLYQFFSECALFCPAFSIIPSFAYGPALIIVGLLMMSPITKLRFNDLSDSIPVFGIIILMSFSYNLGIGMTAGFVLYPVFKIFSGQRNQITPGLWILAVLSLLFFIFYPY
jgi:AGZA family xanthine/uracil permease-like MFS transporter